MRLESTDFASVMIDDVGCSVPSVYTKYVVLVFTWYIESIKQMTIKRRSSHIVPAYHLLGLRSADDVTIDCWWRHNVQTIVMRAHEKCYITRWISISFTSIFTAVGIRKTRYFIIDGPYIINLNIILGFTQESWRYAFHVLLPWCD